MFKFKWVSGVPAEFLCMTPGYNTLLLQTFEYIYMYDFIYLLYVHAATTIIYIYIFICLPFTSCVV